MLYRLSYAHHRLESVDYRIALLHIGAICARFVTIVHTSDLVAILVDVLKRSAATLAVPQSRIARKLTPFCDPRSSLLRVAVRPSARRR